MPLFDAQLAAFLEGDAAQCVATADHEHRPVVGRAWGLRVDREHAEVRSVVGADRATAANLAVGRRIALVAADVATYRSVQLKGEITSVMAAGPRDRRTYDTYRHRFATAVAAVGGTTPMGAVWPSAIVVVTIAVDAVFDQTPGAGAGAPLDAS